MMCRINEDQSENFLIITLKNTKRSVPLTLDDLEFSQTFTFHAIKIQASQDYG